MLFRSSDLSETGWKLGALGSVVVLPKMKLKKKSLNGPHGTHKSEENMA